MKTWQELLGKEKQQLYFQQMMDFVDTQIKSGKTIYPHQNDIFRAFEMTEFDSVKVVILGQDPYHGPNQAHGLCFSVQPGIKTPPSLANIYKELANDEFDFTCPSHGNLTSWAQQGVLLLNTVLTVEQGKAHSHAKIGWEQFTDKVIAVLNQHGNNLVFLLWGSHAQKKGAMIDRNIHSVLEAPHPSPLSAYRGFLGCRHFSKCNQILIQRGLTPINWQV